MVDEYISREALMQAVENVVNNRPRGGAIDLTRKFLAVIDKIKTAPTADVEEVRHGEWEKWSRRLFGWDHRCSECKKDAEEGNSGCYDVLTPYCRYCGTKMDGKQKDGAANG